MNKKVIKTIIISLALIFIFNIGSVLAADDPFKDCDPDAGDICYTPEVEIPGFAGEVKVDSSLLGNYISVLYQYLLYVAGVLAVIVIMVGGFQWITAGGNQSKIGEAKERVMSAIIGLFLALGSYLLLFTINPDLIKIHDLNMPNIEPITDYCKENQIVKPSSPLNADKAKSMGIYSKLVNQSSGADGLEAFCGFNYDYPIEGKNYQCKGTYCNDNKRCINGKCIAPLTLCYDLWPEKARDVKQGEVIAFGGGSESFCVGWKLAANYLKVCNYLDYSSIKDNECSSFNVFTDGCAVFACYMRQDCYIKKPGAVFTWHCKPVE